jgi:hypothetical protein
MTPSMLNLKFKDKILNDNFSKREELMNGGLFNGN